MPDTATTPSNAKPNNLQGAPKTSDKLVAMGTLALTQAPVAAAPLLTKLTDGAINAQGAGGIAVTMIGGGIAVIVQALSAQDWFDDYKYAVWACILLSAIICGALYIIVIGNPELGVLNTLGSMQTAASSYGPLNKLGVYSRPGDTPDKVAAPDVPDVDAVIETDNVENVEVQK